MGKMKTALVNGKIYVERGVFQSAAAMENGIITAVGTDEEILAHAGKDARIIDCEGRTVIPGLNDSHMHLLMMGAGLYQVDINGVKSIDEMIARARAFMTALAGTRICLKGRSAYPRGMIWIKFQPKYQSCLSAYAVMWLPQTQGR